MGKNLFLAFPQATRIGFTGTPLITERHKKQTAERFYQVKDQYIDTYKMNDAVADGATVDIKYIGKKTSDNIKDKEVFDLEYEQTFKHRTEEERQEIHTSMIEILAGKEIATVPLHLDATPVSSKWAEHVGIKIRTLRTSAGMTQNQLAEKAGLQQSNISRIESAEYSPTHMTLSKIAKVLDVEVGTIDPCVPE